MNALGPVATIEQKSISFAMNLLQANYHGKGWLSCSNYDEAWPLLSLEYLRPVCMVCTSRGVNSKTLAKYTLEPPI